MNHYKIKKAHQTTNKIYFYTDSKAADFTKQYKIILRQKCTQIH